MRLQNRQRRPSKQGHQKGKVQGQADEAGFFHDGQLRVAFFPAIADRRQSARKIGFADSDPVPSTDEAPFDGLVIGLFPHLLSGEIGLLVGILGALRTYRCSSISKTSGIAMTAAATAIPAIANSAALRRMPTAARNAKQVTMKGSQHRGPRNGQQQHTDDERQQCKANAKTLPRFPVSVGLPEQARQRHVHEGTEHVGIARQATIKIEFSGRHHALLPSQRCKERQSHNREQVIRGPLPTESRNPILSACKEAEGDKRKGKRLHQRQVRNLRPEVRRYAPAHVDRKNQAHVVSQDRQIFVRSR